MKESQIQKWFHDQLVKNGLAREGTKVFIGEVTEDLVSDHTFVSVQGKLPVKIGIKGRSRIVHDFASPGECMTRKMDYTKAHLKVWKGKKVAFTQPTKGGKPFSFHWMLVPELETFRRRLREEKIIRVVTRKKFKEPPEDSVVIGTGYAAGEEQQFQGFESDWTRMFNQPHNTDKFRGPVTNDEGETFEPFFFLWDKDESEWIDHKDARADIDEIGTSVRKVPCRYSSMAKRDGLASMEQALNLVGAHTLEWSPGDEVAENDKKPAKKVAKKKATRKRKPVAKKKTAKKSKSKSDAKDEVVEDLRTSKRLTQTARRVKKKPAA